MKRLTGIFLLFAAVLMLAGIGMAQEGENVIADGLHSPRHITVGEDGTIYIAEAGVGGDAETTGTFGPAMGGGTSTITVVRPDGTQELLMYGLPSLNWGNGEILGAHMAYPVGDALWLVLGQGATVGSLDAPFTYSLLELDAETLRIRDYVDVLSYEVENNPDGNEIDSNPVDLEVSADGTIYLADAGANTVYTYSPDAGLSVFATWSDNSVPTSVETDADGNVYVSFLTGFPFPTGGSRVEVYSADGTLQETYPGLTMVVDLLTDGESLYAVEFATFGDQGYNPNSGRVVAVSAEGLTPLAEGLNFPYGIALNANGELLVAVDTSFTQELDAGRVISLGAISDLAAGAAPEAPAATEEAAAAAPEEPVATEEAEVPPPVATEEAGS